MIWAEPTVVRTTIYRFGIKELRQFAGLNVISAALVIFDISSD